MKVDKYKQRAEFRGEDGERLEVNYANRGEPYREGIDIALYENRKLSYIFLEDREAKELRDLLNRLYP